MNRKASINLLSEQMNFNVDKCSVIDIGHNNHMHTRPQVSKHRETSCITENIVEFLALKMKYTNKKEIILPQYKSLVRPHRENAVQLFSILFEDETLIKVKKISREHKIYSRN